MNRFDPAKTAFVISTNGEEWCSENFPGVQILDNNDIEEFYILSRLDGCIMSNSTYGWWVAYMAGFTDTAVIPDPWIRTIEYSEGLYLPGWIRQRH
jgi:hypothetical protein